MDYEGKKWKELSESEQERLLRTANAIDGRTGNDMGQDGECIIDLEYPFSVSGRLEDGEIVIDDEAVIYNPSKWFKNKINIGLEMR